MIDFSTIIATIGIPVIRSIGGWATKATADGKITKFEFKKLLETVLKTGVYGLMIFLGASGFGIPIEPVAAGASAVVLDLILSAVKENKNITKR